MRELLLIELQIERRDILSSFLWGKLQSARVGGVGSGTGVMSTPVLQWVGGGGGGIRVLQEVVAAGGFHNSRLSIIGIVVWNVIAERIRFR